MSQNGGVPYHLNSSLRESHIPTIWKRAILVPKPKVNPVTNPTKVLRPIFLTHIYMYSQNYGKLSCPLPLIRYQPIRRSEWNFDHPRKIVHHVYEATYGSKTFVQVL